MGVAVTQKHTAVTGNVTAVLGLFCYLQYNNMFTMLKMELIFVVSLCRYPRVYWRK